MSARWEVVRGSSRRPLYHRLEFETARVGNVPLRWGAVKPADADNRRAEGAWSWALYDGSLPAGDQGRGRRVAEGTATSWQAARAATERAALERRW